MKKPTQKQGANKPKITQGVGARFNVYKLTVQTPFDGK